MPHIDVLLDHPELEIAPHLRAGAQPAGAPAISPTPVTSPATATVVPVATTAVTPTVVPVAETVAAATPVDRRSSTITSGSDAGCTHFVPHAW
jgi:hypothetical protein